jgi:benzoate-CoA ligase family protein
MIFPAVVLDGERPDPVYHPVSATMATSRIFNAATYFVDRHLSEDRAGKIAIECGEQRVSYGELAARVNQAGNALRNGCDVRPEERIFLLLLDCPEFAYAFFGAIKIGAVPVPVNTLLKPADYEYLLNDSRARVAVISARLLEIFSQIPAERLPHLAHLIVAGGTAELPSKAVSFDSLVLSESCQLSAAPTSRDDSAFWLYSSGSTGPPKACVHLQHDMVVATETYASNILKIGEGDRFFSAAKLFFAYGLGNALYFPLAAGATSILLPDPPSPLNVFRTIERYRPTLFFSSPTNYASLLNFEDNSQQFDLSSIRQAVSAGEALPAALFNRFQSRFGIEILDGIGSTEALHIFISNQPGAVRPGSSGRVVPGCECKLLTEQGETAPPGTIGTLWVKHDAACSHYWNQHEKSKQTFRGEWLSTGDKYRQDDEGYYWHAGRADDMLKVSGVWVSPTEIEAVLVEHETVAEVAVVGRKDRDDLVKPVAWVVLRSGIAASEDLARALQEFVISRLPIFKRPRWIEFTSALPKTATGKIQRYKLRQSP